MHDDLQPNIVTETEAKAQKLTHFAERLKCSKTAIHASSGRLPMAACARWASVSLAGRNEMLNTLLCSNMLEHVLEHAT